MPHETYLPSKIFTPAEANAALPLVRAITTDLVQLSQDVIQRRQRLAVLLAARGDGPVDLYTEELQQMQDELERDAAQLEAYVEELRELGVEPKSGPAGLIDFPCMMNGRLVYLCWQIGEPTVQYWHDLDAGYAGRQELPPELLTADDEPQAHRG